MLIFDQLKKSDPRLRFVALGVLAGVLLLLAGLWYHQVISARHYAETLKSQSFRTVRVPAIRGKILDHNGVALAENRPNYKVNLYLDELRPAFEKEFDRQKVAVLAAKKTKAAAQPTGFLKSLLARLRGQKTTTRLSPSEREALNRYVRYVVVSNLVANLSTQITTPLSVVETNLHNHYLTRRALPMQLVDNLNFRQIALFQERFAGAAELKLDIQPVRIYPYASATAHVLGYIKRDNDSVEGEEANVDYRLPDYRGVLGIEGGMDQHLHGRAGVHAMLVNNLGYRQSDEIWSAPEPGKNVVLTLDLHLQTNAWRAFRAQQGTTGRGAVVVMDASNGDILALVSSPAYDPNTFYPSITVEEMTRLQDPFLKPTRNRATQVTGYYAPGSIFKIVTGIAALEAGLDPNETFRFGPHPRKVNQGVIYVGKRDIADPAGPGEYNFRRAFIRSSNAYFVRCGMDAGLEAIRRLGAHLHLAERSGLPLLQDSPGIFPTRDWVLQARGGGWSEGDTANICFGQGDLTVTPVEMAVMVSAVANGGKVYWPRLVDRIEPQEFGGEAPEHFPAGRLRDELGVKPRTLEIVREAMFADVEDANGTGRAASVVGIKIGGKTGTAQKTLAGKVIDHVTWFASFGIHQDRTYAVIVMVESGISGGGTSAPIARQVYQAILNRDTQPKGTRASHVATGNP